MMPDMEIIRSVGYHEIARLLQRDSVACVRSGGHDRRCAELQDRHYERASSDAVSRECSASVIE
jgi:hypothetical protein